VLPHAAPGTVVPGADAKLCNADATTLIRANDHEGNVATAADAGTSPRIAHNSPVRRARGEFQLSCS
jgi:hypothetical protein